MPAPGQPAWQYGIQLINDCLLMTGIAFDPAVDIDADGTYHYHGLLLNTSLSLFQVFDPPGSTITLPFGINNAGLFVGSYLKEDGTWHGFFSHRGKSFMDLDPPGSMHAGATSINNEGEIVGGYREDTDGDWHTDGWRGFLLRSGRFAAFIIPKSSWTSVDCITDNGQLSGEYVLDGKPLAFIATRKGCRN